MRIASRLLRIEREHPAPRPIVLTPDERRKEAFALRHPLYPELERVTELAKARGATEVGDFLDDPEWFRLYQVIDDAFWKEEFAARERRGPRCQCRSFNHPACMPGAPR